jgi:hypothetical protein
LGQSSRHIPQPLHQSGLIWCFFNFGLAIKKPRSSIYTNRFASCVYKIDSPAISGIRHFRHFRHFINFLI